MRLKKRLWALALVAMIFVSVLGQHVTVVRAETVASGTFGSDNTWMLDSDGVLTVSGSSPIRDFRYGGLPWSEYEDQIKAVEASEKCGDNLVWTLNRDGTLTISGMGEMQNFTDPNQEVPWFSYNKFIRKVKVENGVTSIGDNAFTYESTIEEVTLPETVTVIGDAAFQFCSALKNVTLSEGLRSISDYAFQDCTGLNMVNIPESVEMIGNYAFSDCHGLTELIIPDSVTTLGKYVLSNCENITNFTFPKGVSSIPDGFFNCCHTLKEVKIPETVKAIGEEAFVSCWALEQIYLPDSITEIGKAAFRTCKSLKAIEIPNGVSTVHSDTFRYDAVLEKATIPHSVTAIEKQAFGGCDKLADVYYYGTKDEWENIAIDTTYDYLGSTSPLFENSNPSQKLATIHYNYKKNPADFSIVARTVPSPSYSTSSGYNTSELQVTISVTGLMPEDQVIRAYENVHVSIELPSALSLSPTDVTQKTSAYHYDSLPIMQVNNDFQFTAYIDQSQGYVGSFNIKYTLTAGGYEEPVTGSTSIYVNHPDGGGGGGQSTDPVSDGNVTYRALIINGDENNSTTGTDNDVAIIYDRLKNSAHFDEANIHFLNFNSVSNPIEDPATVINKAWDSFEGADDDDISILYYSGHGSKAITSSGNFAASMALDCRSAEVYKDLHWSTLISSILNRRKGKLIVIIDSCYAGNIVENEISTFPEGSSSRICVLTSSAADEQSFNVAKGFLFDKMFKTGNLTNIGCLTYYIGMGTGFFDDKLHADTNRNGIVTFKELVDFVTPLVGLEDIRKIERNEQGQEVIKKTTMSVQNFAESLNREIKVFDLPVHDSDRFVLDEDAWSFSNSAHSFNGEYGNRTVPIPDARYDETLGKSYLEVFKDKRGIDEKYGGYCEGMTNAARHMFLGRFTKDILNGKADTNHYYDSIKSYKVLDKYVTIDPSSEVMRLIQDYNLYQEAYFFNIFEVAKKDGINEYLTEDTVEQLSVGNQYKHSYLQGYAGHNGSYVKNMLQKAQNAYSQNTPLMVSIHAGFGSKAGGHSLLVRTDKAPATDPVLNPTGDTNSWWRVYVYDPNYPYVNEDVAWAVLVKDIDAFFQLNSPINGRIESGSDSYMLLNPGRNIWRYSGSITSTTDSDWLGSNPSDDSIKFYTTTQTDDHGQYSCTRPDFFYFYDPNELIHGDFKTYGCDEGWKQIGEAKIILFLNSNTNCVVNDTDGNIIAFSSDNGGGGVGADVTFVARAGEGEYNGGALVLPREELSITGCTGTFEIVGNDRAVYFNASGSCDVQVNLDTGDVSAQAGDSDTVIDVRVLNLLDNDETEYVETTGTLAAQTNIHLGIGEDGQFVADTDGTNKFDIFFKTENVNQSEYETTIPSAEYSVTAEVVPAEAGTVSGAGTYGSGSEATLTATVSDGYHFVNWTENGQEVSTDNPYTFTVNADRTLVANFEVNKPGTHNITVSSSSSDAGTISGGGEAEAGSTITLTATPNEGYHFVRWEENGAEVSTDNPYTFTADADRTITAVFEEDTKQYTVSATAAPENGGTVAGAGTFDAGTEITVTATPAAGYHFVRWTKGGETVSTEAEYVFSLTEDTELAAVFDKDTEDVKEYEVSITGGTAEPGFAKAGQTITVKADPAPDGMEFDKWEVLEGDITLADPSSETTTFTMGSGKVRLQAVYKKKEEHVHKLTLVPAKAPTELEPGNKAYYICEGCGKLFEDPNGTKEITDRISVFIPPTGGRYAARTPNASEPEVNYHTHNMVTAQWKITREATPTDDGEISLFCMECGEVLDTKPISGYYAFLVESGKKIRNAKSGAEVVISTNKWISFNGIVLDELKARPDVKLVVDYRYKGQTWEVIIPAGTDTDALKNEEGYAGFEFLAGKFGKHEIKVIQ